MNNPPSPTGIQAGGVSDPPIRRSPRLEHRRLLLGGNGDGASSPAPAQDGTVAQGGVRGTAAHAGRVVATTTTGTSKN